MFSIEQLDVIFSLKPAKNPKLHLQSIHRNPFFHELSNSLFEETDFSMGMNTSKCNKIEESPSVFFHLFPS